MTGRKSHYGPADLAARGFDPERDLGTPGNFPFTRHRHGGSSGPAAPSNAVYAGYASPEATNERYRRLVQLGTDAIAMAVDLPTQLGLDPDDEMSFGEVGRVGVPIASLADLETVFDGIPLSSLQSVGMLGNSIGPIAVALFAVLGDKQGLDPGDYVVELQNDVLKEYVARGTQILPVEPAARMCSDVIAWCIDNAPTWRPITVCSNHVEAAGASAPVAQAIAFANAEHYVDDVTSRGYSPSATLSMISMFINERADFFAAVANFRACRRLWARLMSQRHDLRPDERSALALRLTSYAHGGETRLEPENNAVRNALMALAAHFGGADFLNIASLDEALNLPSEANVKLAVRTNQILAEELHLHDVVDPFGGSYFMETLTSEVEDVMAETIKEIDDDGGAVRAIHTGRYLRLIEIGAEERRRAVDAGGFRKVGVDIHRDPSAAVPETTFSLDADLTTAQRDRVSTLKERRDAAKVTRALHDVDDAARAGENSVPAVIEAVQAYATVGEICAIWRSAFGEWRADGSF